MPNVTPPGEGPETQVQTFTDFTGGLNYISDTFKLQHNESPHMVNVDVTARGGVQRRRGWLEQFSSAQTRGWGHVGDQTAGDHMAFQTDDDELWYWDGGVPIQLILNAGTDTATTASVVDPAVVSGDTNWVENCLHWATHDYVGYGMRGDAATPRATISYDAAGVEAKTDSSIDAMSDPAITTWQDDFDVPSGTHFPIGKTAASHLQYIFAAHTYENSVHMHNRIRWSHPGDAGSWRENDYIDIEPGHDGDHVVQVVSFRDQLVVFKNRSVHVVSGYNSDTFSVQKIAGEVGASGPSAVAVSEVGVFFFDRHQGLFVYDGKGVQWLFDKLHPALLDGSIESPDTVNIAVLGRRVWVNTRWNHATMTDAGRTFIYDFDVRSWTCYAGFTEDGDAIPNNHVKHAFMYSSDGTTSYPYAELAYNYGATDISSLCRVDIEGSFTDTITSGPATSARLTEALFVTPWIDMGDPAREKRWRRPEFLLSGGYDQTTIVRVYNDWNASTVSKTLTLVTEAAGGTFTWGGHNWGTMQWSEVADLYEVIVRGGALGATGRSLQFEFVAPDDANVWELNAYMLKWRNKRVKG